MATYAELRSLFNNDSLLEKIETALIKSASTKAGGTPTAAENDWIYAVFANPRDEAKKAIMAVLAANSAESVQTILDATDVSIQTNVDAIVDIFINARAGV